MEFRQAKISDLDQIVEIIELSKKYLKETKVDQWQDGYPAKEDLRRDIESGNSYVLTNKGEIVATTVISLEGESTYNSIFNGEWITNEEYIVMHRVAVHDKYKGKGIPFTAVLPGGPLPSGLFQNPYLYVGVKIVLKDETVLAIYVSKEKTMVNTDQYIQDRKIAKKIEEMIKNVCEIS